MRALMPSLSRSVFPAPTTSSWPGDGVVMLDFGQQAGVTQPDEVAFGGTIEFGVSPTTDGHHDYAPRYPLLCARARAASRAPGASRAPFTSPAWPTTTRKPLDRHEADKLGDTWLKPDAGAGWHV